MERKKSDFKVGKASRKEDTRWKNHLAIACKLVQIHTSRILPELTEEPSLKLNLTSLDIRKLRNKKSYFQNDFFSIRQIYSGI